MELACLEKTNAVLGACGGNFEAQNNLEEFDRTIEFDVTAAVKRSRK